MWRHHNSWTNLGLMIPPSDIERQRFVSPGALNHTNSSRTYNCSLQQVTQLIPATACHDRICQSQHSLFPLMISCHFVFRVSDMNPLVVAAVFKMERCAVEGRAVRLICPIGFTCLRVKDRGKLNDGNERWGSWWREEGRYCFMRPCFGLAFASCVQAGASHNP